MVNINETLAALAASAGASEEEREGVRLQALDDFLAAVNGSATDKFQALEALKLRAASDLEGLNQRDWVMQVIDVRSTELTASMTGIGTAFVTSDLMTAEEPESPDAQA